LEIIFAKAAESFGFDKVTRVVEDNSETDNQFNDLQYYQYNLSVTPARHFIHTGIPEMLN